MSSFDEVNATADELWEWYMKEYESVNPLAAKLYDNFFSKFNKITPLLADDARVLEVGCGPGESSLRLKEILGERHFEVSEFDERLVGKLKEFKPELNAIQESVYDMKRADGSFDCVFLLEVLEHLEDVETALKELFRVSSRYVVVSVPNEPFWCMTNMARFKYLSSFGNTPGHINHWSPGALKKLIGQYGEVKAIYKPYPWIILLAEKRSPAL